METEARRKHDEMRRPYRRNLVIAREPEVGATSVTDEPVSLPA